MALLKPNWMDLEKFGGIYMLIKAGEASHCGVSRPAYMHGRVSSCILQKWDHTRQTSLSEALL